VTSAERIPFAAQIPTVAESGLPGFDVSDGQCLYMPGKTPPEFVRKVHDDVIAALATPAVRQKFIDINVLIVTSAPKEVTTYLRAQMTQWSAIINDANIKAN
jgi:tripartite-type tricarboxylate transporter receptor subunit TctC